MQEKIARKWLLQAEHDLVMAERNIEIEGYDVSAFLAHQAVEKLLKGIIALRGNKIPRIHNLDELAHKLNLPENALDSIEELAAEYVLARYPDMSREVPFNQYDRELALEKVNSAKHIFKVLQGERRKCVDEEVQ